MLRSVLAVLVILPIVHSLFETTPSIKQIKNSKQLNKLLYELEQVSVIFYHVENCENCRNAQGLIEKVAEENDHFRVFHIDCKQIWNFDEDAQPMVPHCNPSHRDQLPQVSFYQPPLKRINPYTNQPLASQEQRFQGEASPKSLQTFGNNLLHTYRVPIKSLEEFHQFEKKEPKLNKVILFTEKKTTAPIYKTLSSVFLQRLYFAEVVESEEKEIQSLLDEFDIEEFPQIFLLERKEDSEEYTRERYEGDLTWKPLKSYLEDYAQLEKVELEHPEDIFPPSKKSESDSKEKRKRRSRNQNNEDKEEPQQQQGEEPQQQKTTSKELTEALFDNELLKIEKPVLLHLYKDDRVHKAWEDSMKKFKSIFEYYTLKVTPETEKFAREQLSAKQFPSIRFFPIGNPQKKRATKVFFPDNMDFEEIFKDLSDLIDDNSRSLNEQNLQIQLQSGLTEGKVILILFYNTQNVGLTYRVFSSLSDYAEKYRFLSYKNAPEVVLQQFGITAQPVVVAVFREVQSPEQLEQPLSNDQIKMASFTGKMMFNEFKEFLNVFDGERRKSQKSSSALIEITSQEQFQEICEEKVQVCFIALLNGMHQNVFSSINKIKKEKQNEESTKTRFEHQIEVITKIKNIYGSKPAAFVYLDASCHDEILFPLDLSDDLLPNYIAYNANKKYYARYSKLIGILDVESISRFIDNHLKGRTSIFNLQEKLHLTSKDCEQVLQERKQRQTSSESTEDDDILKEILEEERKKREAIQKELKEEKKKNKKKKGKKDDL